MRLVAARRGRWHGGTRRKSVGRQTTDGKKDERERKKEMSS